MKLKRFFNKIDIQINEALLDVNTMRDVSSGKMKRYNKEDDLEEGMKRKNLESSIVKLFDLYDAGKISRFSIIHSLRSLFAGKEITDIISLSEGRKGNYHTTLTISYEYMDFLNKYTNDPVRKMVNDYIKRNKVEYEKDDDGMKLFFRNRQQYLSYKHWARNKISKLYEV